jgi:hypothetical protein
MCCSFKSGSRKSWITHNNKHPLRSNTEGYCSKTHYTDSEDSNTMVLSGRKMLSVLAASNFWIRLCVHIFQTCSLKCTLPYWHWCLLLIQTYCCRTNSSTNTTCHNLIFLHFIIRYNIQRRDSSKSCRSSWDSTLCLKTNQHSQPCLVKFSF